MEPKAQKGTNSRASEGAWWDASYRHGPDGDGSPNFFMRMWEGVRRMRHENWFELICGLDSQKRTAFPVGSGRQIVAAVDGELTCFANDVWLMYWNNTGAIQMTVSPNRLDGRTRLEAPMKLKAALICICLSLLGAASALASGTDPAARSRRLVICLDGTLNNPEQSVETVGTHKLYKPTNVLKTYRAVLPVAADGRSQIAFYSEGVGSFIGEPVPLAGLQKLVDNAAGGAFGVGFQRGLKSAYRFLVANYQEGDHQQGDEIFVFGFSRGAAQAQGLVRFIDWAHGLLHKDDEYYIPELFDGFSQGLDVKTVLNTIRGRSGSKEPLAREQEQCRENLRESEKTHKQDRHMACDDKREPPDHSRVKDPRPVDIQFLGVYETVISLGSGPAADLKFRFLAGKTPPAIVKKARQALAIDERRWDFRPQVWQGAANSSQSVEQVWFPGVHSDIGGGYTHDGLANAALHWIISEAMAAGLEVDCRYLGHYWPWVCGDRPDTDSGWMRIAELIRGKSGRGVRELPEGARLHDSVAWLLLNDKTYRPQNLLRYLAQDEKRIDQFPDPQRSGVRAIVSEFKAGTGSKRSPCRRRTAQSAAEPGN
jgi:uncharacterized protein (DUF2235 family)